MEVMGVNVEPTQVLQHTPTQPLQFNHLALPLVDVGRGANILNFSS